MPRTPHDSLWTATAPAGDLIDFAVRDTVDAGAVAAAMETEDDSSRAFEVILDSDVLQNVVVD